MEGAQRCMTCGIPLTQQGKASFPCPKCGNVTIGRCEMCRGQSVIYTCPECGFSGP